MGLVYLAQIGDAVRAEQLFRIALKLAPYMLESQVNLGLALHEQGRSEEALRHYDDLVQKNPGNVEYRWHRATVRLALGSFAEGWEDYESRKLRGDRWWRRPPQFREWDGAPRGNGELLVYAEQGVGDEIVFASCLPDVLSVANQCVVECDVRLATLFQRSFPGAVVHGTSRNRDQAWLARHPTLEVQCAIGSLPRFFRRSHDSFRSRPTCLHADLTRANKWRSRLSSRQDVMNVGISWRAGTLMTREELRSTNFLDWAPGPRTKGFRFFALQDPSADELVALSTTGKMELLKLPNMHDDLDELAAAVTALDLVISVDNTIAHLCGALGRPIWILLSEPCDWRYLQASEHMPWYSTARLFRQPRSRDWQSVFQTIAEALIAFR